jgi:hypothetical protein
MKRMKTDVVASIKASRLTGRSENRSLESGYSGRGPDWAPLSFSLLSEMQSMDPLSKTFLERTDIVNRFANWFEV